MAEKEIYDCERMVMRAQYLMSLKAASSMQARCQIWNVKITEDR